MAQLMVLVKARGGSLHRCHLRRKSLGPINDRYEAWELKAIGASKVEQLLRSHLRSKIRSMETQCIFRVAYAFTVHSIDAVCLKVMATSGLYTRSTTVQGFAF